jgi:hypothetical protein
LDADSHRDALLKAVEAAVEEACAWFAGPGLNSQARVDEWGPREVLAHFFYWHRLTIDAVESVSQGGPPGRLQASLDETNAAALAGLAGKAIPDLLAEFRALHEDYMARVGAFNDLDAILRVRSDGRGAKLPEQLELNARHIRNHLAQLREAEAARPPAQ